MKIFEESIIENGAAGADASSNRVVERVAMKIEDVPVCANSVERANDVLMRGKISLDSKLGVFTVVGSNEKTCLAIHNNNMLVPSSW